MTRCFISTSTNKIGEVQTDPNTGSLAKMTMHPSGPTREDTGKGRTATEWIVQHPKANLLLSLTSYWNKHPAHLNIFQVEKEGLTPLTVDASTAARQAVHAVFAPTVPNPNNDKVCLAIAHHNDGFVSFFQMDAQGPPTSLMDQPTLTLELPAIEPNQKKVLQANQNLGLSLPACHHVFYPPHGKYIMMVDCTQSIVFTYAVNPDTGLPTNPNEPSSMFHCHTDAQPLGWVSGFINKVCRLGCRPRRVALSPNGKYIYISYEYRNTIQVYPVDPETGRIDPDNQGCRQEVSTLDKELTQQPLIGMAVQGSAEMIVSGNFLYVSNRGGTKAKLGRCESSVRVFEIQDGGRLVTATAQALTCKGPVRHFCVHDSGENEVLVAGTSMTEESNLCLQTFRRRKEEGQQYELVGTADVGVPILCVLPVQEE